MHHAVFDGEGAMDQAGGGTEAAPPPSPSVTAANGAAADAAGRRMGAEESAPPAVPGAAKVAMVYSRGQDVITTDSGKAVGFDAWAKAERPGFSAKGEVDVGATSNRLAGELDFKNKGGKGVALNAELGPLGGASVSAITTAGPVTFGVYVRVGSRHGLVAVTLNVGEGHPRINTFLHWILRAGSAAIDPWGAALDTGLELWQDWRDHRNKANTPSPAAPAGASPQGGAVSFSGADVVCFLTIADCADLMQREALVMRGYFPEMPNPLTQCMSLAPDQLEALSAASAAPKPPDSGQK
jgi:hypothetical protein